MSGGPVYWSQPNQQVVRDGEPVGIIDNGPDPQQAKSTGKKRSTTKDDD